MTDEQEKHLQDIKDWICDRVDKKYRAGQKEHGGDLWKKPYVFQMLVEEIVDAVPYAYTHQQHLDDPSMVDQNLKDN
jgi:hypothetical protein